MPIQLTSRFLTAADYMAMFEPLLKQEPEVAILTAFQSNRNMEAEKTQLSHMAQNNIDWVKRVLRKQDRITWFLRWYRLALMKAFYPSMFEVEWPKYMAKARGVALNVGDVPSMNMFSLLRTQLLHFMSLGIPAIDNMVFGYESYEQLHQFWVEAENKWRNERENHLSPRHGDRIVLQCEDGSAWWLLDREQCSDEAKAMGHCGNSGNPQLGDRILSFRTPKKIKGKGTVWQPHLTFILDGNGYLGEMKGRGNQKPSEKYNPYILQLLLQSSLIKGVKGGGYLPENNFDVRSLGDDGVRQLMLKNPDAIPVDMLYEMEGASDRVVRTLDVLLDLNSRYVPEWQAFIVTTWPNPQECCYQRGTDTAQTVAALLYRGQTSDVLHNMQKYFEADQLQLSRGGEAAAMTYRRLLRNLTMAFLNSGEGNTTHTHLTQPQLEQYRKNNAKKPGYRVFPTSPEGNPVPTRRSQWEGEMPMLDLEAECFEILPVKEAILFAIDPHNDSDEFWRQYTDGESAILNVSTKWMSEGEK